MSEVFRKALNYLKWRNFGEDLIWRSQKKIKFGANLILSSSESPPYIEWRD